MKYLKLFEHYTIDKQSIYGYWDLANALDITDFISFLKDNDILHKYDRYSNKLEIEVETMDNDIHNIILAELDKIESDTTESTTDDVILITPIKYY